MILIFRFPRAHLIFLFPDASLPSTPSSHRLVPHCPIIWYSKFTLVSFRGSSSRVVVPEPPPTPNGSPAKAFWYSADSPHYGIPMLDVRGTHEIRSFGRRREAGSSCTRVPGGFIRIRPLLGPDTRRPPWNVGNARAYWCDLSRGVGNRIRNRRKMENDEEEWKIYRNTYICDWQNFLKS